MKQGIIFSVSHSSKVSVSQCSRGYGTVVFSGHAKLDLRCGILLGFSKPKFGIIFKPHKSHVGDLAPPLGWALDEEGVGSELVEENIDSDDSSVNSESKCVNSLNLDHVKDSDHEGKMRGAALKADVVSIYDE